MNEDRNLALPAVPAASTKGSTGRQHVAAARTLPTADSAAASPPFEEALPVALIKLSVSVFTVLLPAGLSALPDELSPLVEARPASIQDTNGNSVRNSGRPVALRRHLVR